MFGYMTELDKVDVDEDMTCEFEVEGERGPIYAPVCTSTPFRIHISSASATRIVWSPGADLLSLLYNLLDEFLFRFTADDCMVCKEVRVLEFDTDNGRMKVQA